MFVIVGLGNTGKKYERTRHNAGRLAVSAFVETCGGTFVTSARYAGLVWEGVVGKESVLALLPECFMNQSGGSVKKAVKTVAHAEQLIVVYDDIDLPLGTVRISFDRGSGGHNGLRSIAGALKTEKFIRIRIGISQTVAGTTKKPKTAEGVLKWVMGDFKKSEGSAFEEVTRRVGQMIEHIVARGVTSAMNTFN